jgi:hypothetical protein
VVDTFVAISAGGQEQPDPDGILLKAIHSAMK